jgi:alkyl hydroperoxide reductase subunit F
MEKLMVYDLIIIGAGPAGMTAAIYAARKKLKVLIISKDIGGQASLSSDIENYPGFAMITGTELVKNFEKHLDEFKDDICLKLTNSGIDKISKRGELVEIHSADGQAERAKALIISSGKVPKKLGIKGEEEFLNKGVSYCAWCDGPLFAKREVAVIGGGNSALDTAINLSKVAKQIYIINVNPKLTGDKAMVDKVSQSHNIRIINNATTLEIQGDKLVGAIKIHDKQTGLDKNIEVEGVFIEIGQVPATDYLEGTIDLNSQGEIKINKHNSTNIEGIFAAGDITNVAEKQIIIAAGEGAKAAIAASKYLSSKE